VKLKLAGGEIAWDAAGSGPALVLLHAFPLSRRMWQPQWEALAGGCRLLRFDYRGFGESPPTGGILTMERCADDAVGLLDHAGVSKAVVCGVSMGGYVALALARRHPARLRGLVLADTRAGADTPQARAGRSQLAERIRREGSGVATEMLPRLLGATTRARRPALEAELRGWIEATAPAGLCDGLAGLAARADSGPGLERIDIPTLVVCGEEDELTPPEESRRLAEAIPGARLELIPEAGHLASLEQPEVFNRALRAFLDGLPAV
jgi:pimeloyl-ACP methyl ester carboxylesterase